MSFGHVLPYIYLNWRFHSRLTFMPTSLTCTSSCVSNCLSPFALASWTHHSLHLALPGKLNCRWQPSVSHLVIEVLCCWKVRKRQHECRVHVMTHISPIGATLAPLAIQQIEINEFCLLVRSVCCIPWHLCQFHIVATHCLHVLSLP